VTNFLIGVGAFLAMPLLFGLWFFVFVPESRQGMVESVKYDWRRLKGRARHPATRQSRRRYDDDEPWDGWLP
jgi:hypothetical protein